MKKVLLAVSFITLIFTGCKAQFDDVPENPKNPENNEVDSDSETKIDDSKDISEIQKPVLTITFYSDDEITYEQKVYENEEFSLSENKFKKEGYTLWAWNDAPDGSGIWYSDGATLSLTNDLNLYARWCYAFHDEIQYLPEDTKGSIEKGGKYVLFGDFPSSKKSDEVEVDEEKSVQMGEYTYFLGDDDFWYCKADEKSAEYFKVEPIKWRILTENYNETGNTLLFAENILQGGVHFFDSRDSYTLNGKSVYANNYKYSNIRAYLNGIQNQAIIDNTGGGSYKRTDWTDKGFLQTAFSEEAQKLIQVTKVDNSKKSIQQYGKTSSYVNENYICDDTDDKIFLLSTNEVTNTNYNFKEGDWFGAGNGRVRKPTDWAQMKGVSQSKTSVYGGRWYFRSFSSSYSYHAAIAIDSGMVANLEVYKDDCGIVPAIVVSLK